MTQGDFGVAIILFVLTAGFSLYQAGGPLRREQRKTLRYRLFAVRDKLVLLVAQGTLRENDPVFQFLYPLINHVIPRARPLTLRVFVEVLSKTPIINDQWRRDFLASINHHDPAVRDVAREFFNALAYILFVKSVFVKVSVSCTRSGFTIASWVRRLLSKLLTTESSAYALHKTLDTLAHAV